MFNAYVCVCCSAYAMYLSEFGEFAHTMCVRLPFDMWHLAKLNGFPNPHLTMREKGQILNLVTLPTPVTPREKSHLVAFYVWILPHRPIIVAQRRHKQNASVDWKNLEHICTWMLPTLNRANTFIFFPTCLWQVCFRTVHNVQISAYSDNEVGLRMITKTRKTESQVRRGTRALDNNPVTTYSLHKKGRHHGHKPPILILQNMDSAQSKFINPIHSVATVQLHWSLKNARADSPGAHCVPGRSGFTKGGRDWGGGGHLHECRSQSECMRGKDKRPADQSVFFWPGFSAQPG